MDGQTDEWTVGQMDEQTDAWLNEEMDGWPEGRTAVAASGRRPAERPSGWALADAVK